MSNMLLDYDQLAAELLVFLRGRRTQTGFSRWLGYRSNIAHRWETQKCWPTASKFLEICARRRVNVANCYEMFFQRRPEGVLGRAPTSPQAVAAFLSQVRGRTPLVTLTQRTGYNRFSIARWLKGTAHPKLPEFLCLIEACSRRLLDFVATLAPIGELPSVRAHWEKIQLAREAAYRKPWSHAILRGLELEEYQKNGYRQRGWLAKKLGLPEDRVAEGLELLRATGQVKKRRGRFVPSEVMAVDTGHDPERARQVKIAWVELALSKLKSGAPGNFGYSVFAVSRSDIRQLRALHLQYVTAMQNLIAASEHSECVGLYCAQLLDLSQFDDNALVERDISGQVHGGS